MNLFWIEWIALTVIIAAFSWEISLRARRWHGVARFFAFESILTLFLLNVPFWFDRPLRPLQIASWLSLTVSLVLAVAGFRLLARKGRPEGQIENTTRLVTTGVYRLIRHPLYASLFYLGLGIFLKRPTGLTAALAAVNAVAVWVTAVIEEREMRARFGADYEAYMKRSRRFIPFVF